MRTRRPGAWLVALIGAAALAVAIWVGGATGDVRTIYPTWGAPCGGLPQASLPPAERSRCEQERRALVANPPTSHAFNGMAALAAGGVVAGAAGLSVVAVQRRQNANGGTGR